MSDSTTRRALVRAAAASVKAHAYAKNPFLDGLVLVPKRKSGKVPLAGLSVVHEDTGSMEPAYHAYTRFDDTEPFTKFYRQGMLWKTYLTAPGLKVLDYVCQNLRPGNGVVWLRHTDYAQTTGESRSSYYLGLNELMAANFIAPSEQKGFFFINPSFFFNGSRLKMHHTFTKPVRARAEAGD